MSLQGAAVTIREIFKSYGDTAALNAVSLEILAGEFLTLLGPSGCGKSTMLRLIAGFETPDQGAIAIGGRNLAGLRPKARGLSMVFQNYALYPHLTVRENIATPLVMRQMGFWQRFPLLGRIVPGSTASRKEIDVKVGAVMRLLEIDGLHARRPGQLSGGQRQRVALGRAIAPEPSVFLMDEPLSNLDARLRLQMRNELAELHRKLGITFIYVTHDQVEAMTMSHRIAVMMEGRLVQVGRPSEIYARPADLRVARFIGAYPINVLQGTIDASGLPVIENHRLAARLGLAAGETISIGIRPEDVRLDPVTRRPVGALGLEAVVTKIEDHGADLLAQCTLPSSRGTRLLVRIEPDQRESVLQKLGADCRLHVSLERIHFFGPSGARIEPRNWAEQPAAATI